MTDVRKEALRLHKELGGKLKFGSKMPLKTKKDINMLCNQGAMEAGRAIRDNWRKASDYTGRAHTVAIISDGSHLHGSENVGSLGALPMLEGKSALISEIAGVNAMPLTINTQDPHHFVDVVKQVSSTFGAVMLEDIEFPKCEVIRARLENELRVPVFHNDSQVTAIVALAGLINAMKVVKKRLSKAKIVIMGAGVAGSSVARILAASGAQNITVCDDRGPIFRKRPNMNAGTNKLAEDLKLGKRFESLTDAMKKADIVISLSGTAKLKPTHIESMASDAVVFALSRPTPEITPSEARAAGAKVVATGLFDFKNHVDNAILFPHLLKSMMEHNVRVLTPKISLELAEALAGIIKEPAMENILPDVFDTHLAKVINAVIEKYVPVFTKVKQALQTMIKGKKAKVSKGKTKKAKPAKKMKKVKAKKVVKKKKTQARKNVKKSKKVSKKKRR